VSDEHIRGTRPPCRCVAGPPCPAAWRPVYRPGPVVALQAPPWGGGRGGGLNRRAQSTSKKVSAVARSLCVLDLVRPKTPHSPLRLCGVRFFAQFFRHQFAHRKKHLLAINGLAVFREIDSHKVRGIFFQSGSSRSVSKTKAGTSCPSKNCNYAANMRRGPGHGRRLQRRFILCFSAYVARTSLLPVACRPAAPRRWSADRRGTLVLVSLLSRCCLVVLG